MNGWGKAVAIGYCLAVVKKWFVFEKLQPAVAEVFKEKPANSPAVKDTIVVFLLPLIADAKMKNDYALYNVLLTEKRVIKG